MRAERACISGSPLQPKRQPMPPSPNHRHGSGDAIADARAAYAESYASAGDFSAAAEVMRQALERARDWPLGLVRLAHFLEEGGAVAEAAEALRAVLALDPADRYGASLILARLGKAPVPAAPPSAFVETLFDDYAPRFEAALQGRLAYRVPEELAALIASESGEDPFGAVLDLGCGTGLLGALLRARATRLEGLDLSAAMLAEAEGKRIYDRLERHDLGDPAPLPGAPFDLVTASDVLNYVGDLSGVVERTAAALSPGGLFAFSVEAAGDDDANGVAFVLRPSLRYAHALLPLTRLLEAARFTVLASRAVTLRQDRGEAVAGTLVIAALRPTEG